jgi:hypothetical protein
MFTFRSTFRLVIGAALVLCATACAGSPSGPGVASLGGGASQTKSASATPGNDFNKFLAFSACMRSHGIRDFPDPQQGSGGIRLNLGANGGSSDLNPQSSTFQAAQQACQSLIPAGGPDAGSKADPTKIEPWAACIRSHGVPNLPDPTIENGNMKLVLTGTGIDPGSSQWQKATAACRSLEPGGGMMVQAGPGGGK